MATQNNPTTPLQQQPQQQQGPQQPRDGPATTFEADPKVTDIFTTKDGDYFGLVFVTGWRFDPNIINGPYTDFVESVRECFDPEDLQPQPVSSMSTSTTTSTTTSPRPPAAVYIYPPEHLHVTIATFAIPEPRHVTDNKIQDYTEFQQRYINLVKQASQMSEWPTTSQSSSKLRLVVQSTQIGSKAGIILWKDLSGTIDKIRYCLQQTSIATNVPIHSIPGIIHSTFLRFTNVPKTPGSIVQEKFQSHVVPNLHRIFSSTDTPEQQQDQQSTTTVPMEFSCDNVKLVLESTPYMHIEPDDQHILLSIPVGSGGNNNNNDNDNESGDDNNNES